MRKHQLKECSHLICCTLPLAFRQPVRDITMHLSPMVVTQPLVYDLTGAIIVEDILR